MAVLGSHCLILEIPFITYQTSMLSKERRHGRGFFRKKPGQRSCSLGWDLELLTLQMGMGFWEMKQFFSLLESPLGSPQLIVFMSSQRQMSWEKSFLWNVPNPAEPFRTPLAGSFPGSLLSLILFSFASCSCTDDVHTSLLVAPKSRACKKFLRASWSSVAYVRLRFSEISRPHHVLVYWSIMNTLFSKVLLFSVHAYMWVCECVACPQSMGEFLWHYIASFGVGRQDVCESVTVCVHTHECKCVFVCT